MMGPPTRLPGNPTWHSGAEAPCYGRENVTVSHPPPVAAYQLSPGPMASGVRIAVHPSQSACGWIPRRVRCVTLWCGWVDV